MTSDVLSTLAETRIAWAKGKAKELRDAHGGDAIPFLLRDIVSAFGIPVQAAELQIDGVARADSSGVFIIMYNKNMAEVRQRFTVAHELGHIALEHVGMDGSSQHSTGAQEMEANAFASELLVPSADLKLFLKKKDKTIEEVAKRYWVSRDAAFMAVLNNRLLSRIKA